MNKKDRQKYFVVNPGGNLTALVPIKKGLDKIKINNLIMDLDHTIEQVGFFIVNREKNYYYIEMAGNEFCGNAIRSFALLINNKFAKNITEVYIQTNVFPEKILCRINKKSVSLYFPKNKIREENNFICVGNIAHLISKDFKKQIKINKNYPSTGLIKYKQINKNTFLIEPEIYVKEINTLLKENSCLSGSIAIYYKNAKLKSEFIKICQPSKDILKIKGSKDNKHLIISGMVTMNSK